MHYYNITDIHQFLPCQTPDQWVEDALKHQDLLLIDHANCEKKAASMAISFMYKYHQHVDLCIRMSKIAREELIHYEQVMAIINKRDIPMVSLNASRYAQGLRECIHSDPKRRLVDLLIIGAIVEARSCERFEKIAPHLDQDLSKFYFGLLASEKRHFTVYLDFAYQYAKDFGGDQSYVDSKVSIFLHKEQHLIESLDDQVRFHSGPLKH